MQETNESQKANARPSRFGLRADSPTPKRKLNAKTVLIATGGFSVLFMLVLMLAFSGNMRPVRSLSSTNQDAVPSDAVKELPGDYAELAKRQPKPKVVRETGEQVIVRPPELTAEEKFQQEQRLLRLKRALEARQSDLSFKSVRPAKQGEGRGDDVSLASADLSKLGLSEPMNGEAGLNPRDLDGRQDEKRQFLERARNDQTTLMQGVKPLLSNYQVSAGTVIPGVMITGINSDLPGQILGQVSQRVFDTATGGTVLIPQGTKVLGTYDSRVVYGQERVLVVWTRLMFPNGRSISLEGMPGVDMSGYAGLSDEVNNHYLKLLTGVVLGSVLGAGAQIAEGGTSTVDPSFGQLAAQGLAKNINEAGQQITRKNLAIQPTLEITPGFRFNIFVTKDIVLEPYQD